MLLILMTIPKLCHRTKGAGGYIPKEKMWLFPVPDVSKMEFALCSGSSCGYKEQSKRNISIPPDVFQYQ